MGGRGTRMWPLTADGPKGLLPLAGVPFVEYQIRQLAAVGISDVFLAVGRDSARPWDRYASTPVAGVRLHLAVEDEPLDTAGPVRAILADLDQRFLVLNGDVVVEADLTPLTSSGASACIGLIEVADTSAYGVVVTDPAGVVQRFIEKPPTAEAPALTVNAGIYLLSRESLSAYPEGRLSFERVVFPDLARSGVLRGARLSGRWIDIGTPALYLAAHGELLRGGSTLHRPATPHHAEGADVAGRLAGAWSWIGPGARIATGAVVEESVIMAGAEVGEGATVRNAVVGMKAHIGPGSSVSGAAVVGSGAVVGAGCEIDLGMRVAPGAVLAPGSVTFRPPK